MDKSKIDFVMNNCPPMSCKSDLSIAADFVNYSGATNILELGVGNGNWLLSLNLLIDRPLKFFGYENQSLDYGRNWFNNIINLENDIKFKSQALGKPIDLVIRDEDVKSINIEYIESLNIKFDIVRLDCLHFRKYEVLELLHKLLPFCSDNCIFLVDDIHPNLSPNRFLAFMDLVEEKHLIPVWFGEKEGAWACLDINYIQKEIANKIGKEFHYRGRLEPIEFYSVEYPILSTKNYE